MHKGAEILAPPKLSDTDLFELGGNTGLTKTSRLNKLRKGTKEQCEHLSGEMPESCKSDGTFSGCKARLQTLTGRIHIITNFTFLILLFGTVISTRDRLVSTFGVTGLCF